MPAASFADYAQIMLALPGTLSEISERCRMGRQPVARALKTLHRMEQVHIASVQKRAGTGHPMNVWADGPGQDAAAVRSRPRPIPSLIAFATMWQALREGGTLVGMAQETGISRVSLSRVISANQSRFHVCAWDRSKRGTPVAVWCLGRRPDVPRPEPKTRAEVSREARQRLRLMTLHMLPANTADVQRVAA